MTNGPYKKRPPCVSLSIIERLANNIKTGRWDHSEAKELLPSDSLLGAMILLYQVAMDATPSMEQIEIMLTRFENGQSPL